MFTLIQGEEQRAYAEHPMEIARRALIAAAEIEGEGEWQDTLRRFARVLPDRGRVSAAAIGNVDQQLRRQLDEMREIRAVWKSLDSGRREGLLLDALGTEQLLVAELTARLNDRLCPEGGKSHKAVYESNVRALAMRMMHGGLLVRAPELFRNKTRYRWAPSNDPRQISVSNAAARRRRRARSDGTPLPGGR